MSDWREDLLTSILDCGYGDLYLLEDCQYDIGEMVEECEAQFGKININLLVKTMFNFGLREIEEAIKDRIAELNDIKETEGELREEEQVEREALETLDPFEDVLSFHNFVDTHIWIDAVEKIPIYVKYLKKTLDHFEEMTGFDIGTDYTIV